MAPDMGEDFGLQPELADSLAVLPRLFRCSGRSEFDVFDTEGIQCLGDGNFRLGIEESVCELLSLWFDEKKCQKIPPA